MTWTWSAYMYVSEIDLWCKHDTGWPSSVILGKMGCHAKWNKKAVPPAANEHISPNASPKFPLLEALRHVFISQYLGIYSCQNCFPLWFLFLQSINSDVMIDVIIVMGIRMQNHKWNEVENAFPIFKASRLVRVHTDSHHNGHNKMIFAVSYVW